MKSIGVFYGSSTGNTEMAAEKICEQLGEFVSHCSDVSKVEPADLLPYDILLLGVSTWNIGENLTLVALRRQNRPLRRPQRAII